MTSPSPERYVRQFLAGWRTMDFNGHLANTAYLDLAADVRMAFFADHGFPPTEFKRLAIGPVVRKDELEYSQSCARPVAGSTLLRESSSSRRSSRRCAWFHAPPRSSICHRRDRRRCAIVAFMATVGSPSPDRRPDRAHLVLRPER